MDSKPHQQTTTQEHHANEKTQNNVADSNSDAIHYQDGKIQKKVYGGGDPDAMRQIYVHLIQRTKEDVQTILINAQLQLTVQQACTLLEQKTKIALNNIQVKQKLEGPKTDVNSNLTSFFKQKQQQKPELYVFYDQTKPIIKEKLAQTKYQPITKYSFLDDKKKVKVYIELQGIGKVPADKIVSRFLQWSIEIKIYDYKGKNWIFAVPKTQCLLKPKQSTVIQKQNKLVISIAKNAQADNWFSLYKVKCVGERGDD